MASGMVLLPEPLAPTMPLTPGLKRMTAFWYDLMFCSSSSRMRMAQAAVSCAAAWLGASARRKTS